MKEKIFNIIQIGDKSNIISRCFDKLIISAILLNIAVMFLQTFNYLEKYYTVFKIIEIVTIIIFIAEYILRLWTADFLYSSSKYPRLKYIYV